MQEQSSDRTDRSQEDVGCDDDINLIDYLRVIWKRRSMIAAITIAAVIGTFVYSLSMTDLYQAKAVIMPVTTRDSGSSGNVGLAALAQQFGGLPGISMPGATSASEILGLLRSNILREKIIQQYNLLPILFYERWDAERKTWNKDDSVFTLDSLYRFPLLERALTLLQPGGTPKRDSDIPNTWDAIRLLAEIVRISQDVKQNSITVSAEFHDPEMAAKIVGYYLDTLTNYMSSEAKRVARTNRKYLEEQLGSTADPFIKQKTYNMIAQQIETAMMSEVKENFAFKVIDPPLAPDRTFRPKRAWMVALSFCTALFIGILVAFFREYLENVRKGQ